MNTPKTSKLLQQKPEVTGRDARTQLLDRNKRPIVPLRHTFVQRPQGESPRHGPLKTFVNNGDLRGLRAYLTIVGASGAQRDGRWATRLDSLVWARLFDAEATATQLAARTGAWRTLDRLEQRGLITKGRTERGARHIEVTLLREDASGEPYTRPDGNSENDRFLRIPTAFWKGGLDAEITLPGLAMLLVVAKEKPWSSYPPDRMDEWYGWSADTTQRGLKALLDHGLVERREAYLRAPLSPTGSTLIYQYRLVKWMRPPAGPRPDGSKK
jgi:predicted transcriptional regulator